MSATPRASLEAEVLGDRLEERDNPCTNSPNKESSVFLHNKRPSVDTPATQSPPDRLSQGYGREARSPNCSTGAAHAGCDDKTTKSREETAGQGLNESNTSSSDTTPSTQSEAATPSANGDAAKSPETRAKLTSDSTSSGTQSAKAVPQGRESRGSINVGGKKRYPCPFPGCEKTFSTSGHSSRHSRIHTGEKPYRCSYPGCNAQFSRYDNSLQHYRTHIISSKGGKKTRGKSNAQAASEDATVPEPSRLPSAALARATNEQPASAVPVAEAGPPDDRILRTVQAPPSNMARTHSSQPSSTLSSPVARGPPGLSTSPLDATVAGPYGEAKMAPVALDGARSDSLARIASVDPDRAAGVPAASRVADGSKKIRLDGPAGLAALGPPFDASRTRYAMPYEAVGARDIYTAHGSYLPLHSGRMESPVWSDHREHLELKAPPMDAAPAYGAVNARMLSADLSPSVSSMRSGSSVPQDAALKPPLAESQTFDFGARPVAYPLSGTETDRVPLPLAPYVSESGNRGFRKVVSRHGPESPILQSRPPSFRMRKSGSTPSLLTLEMPRSESSHSLFKYSLSSGMPATSHSLSPVQSIERIGNRMTVSEQYAPDDSKMAVHDPAHGVPNAEFVLPPLSRLT